MPDTIFPVTLTDITGANIIIETRAPRRVGTLIRVGIDDGEFAVNLYLKPEQACELIAALADAWAAASKHTPTRSPKCDECGRVFDLNSDTDAAEWHYGHDCEA